MYKTHGIGGKMISSKYEMRQRLGGRLNDIYDKRLDQTGIR